MNRIYIREADMTSNIPAQLASNIVYIPGFSTKLLDDSDSNGQGNQYGGVHVPTLCTSLNMFYEYFGVDAPVFVEDQINSTAWEWSTEAGVTTHTEGIPALFATEAFDTDAVMYERASYDPSYIYAEELLSAGIPVVYERINEEIVAPTDATVTDETAERWKTKGITAYNMYSYLAGDCYNLSSRLSDKSLNIKFLTSGGYPVFEYSVADDANTPGIACLKMAELASSRGDCVALLDHTNNYTRALSATSADSVYSKITGVRQIDPSGSRLDTYCAMFTPYATYMVSRRAIPFALPGSFAFLSALSTSLNNSQYLAVAGVTRGYVPGLLRLNTSEILTNAIADSYQKSNSGDVATNYGISINAITDISNYGYCIWGNRTLKKTIQNGKGYALSYLNIRNVLSDIKKTVYNAAQNLLFEQNNDILWINFKSKVTPLLNNLQSGNIISRYKIMKDVSDDRTKLVAVITIYPIYSVESFDIRIVLSDDDGIQV